MYMKYLKTYEGLGFELDEDRVGREVYVLMTEDEKYFFDYNSSHDGSLTNYRLVSANKITVTFLENQAKDNPYPKDIMYNGGNDFQIDNKWFLPSGEEYSKDKLKNVKWFLGAYKA